MLRCAGCLHPYGDHLHVVDVRRRDAFGGVAALVEGPCVMTIMVETPQGVALLEPCDCRSPAFLLTAPPRTP